MAVDLTNAACIGKANIMDGRSRADVVAALKLCSGCPVLVPCSQWARSQSRRGTARLGSGFGGGIVGLSGVVGGRVYGDARTWLRPQEKEREKKSA